MLVDSQTLNMIILGKEKKIHGRSRLLQYNSIFRLGSGEIGVINQCL